jgi:N-hydroxyarylamine O-acetyltransferase
MDRAHVDAYLTRIGFDAVPRADLDTLRELQLRHLLAVPFENLSIHLGERIVLDEPALVDKLVHRRRGGFCYELNGAFAALLTALGYRVTRLAARVHAGDRFGPPFDHLTLRIDLAEPWLVDVGFGQFSRHPLRLAVGAEQADPSGVFRFAEHKDAQDTQDTADAQDGDLVVYCDGKPQYLIEPRPRALVDFEPTCWWHQTSPKSHFTRSLVCTRLTPTGRVTMSGRAIITTSSGERHERLLRDDADRLAAYREYFDVVLDRVPVVSEPAATEGVPS